MHDDCTRQALPTEEYRELLGIALYVFNSNNAFIVENVLSSPGGEAYSWCDLIDKNSGKLKEPVETTIAKSSGDRIAALFSGVIAKRNRIVHSFPITDDDGEQRLATKDKDHNQFVITEGYLLDFIRDNQLLSDALHECRGY